MDISEARQGVLIEMCFNMGIYNLLKFEKMIRALRLEDYKSASLQMLDSKWAKQVGQRAHRLAVIMNTNEL